MGFQHLNSEHNVNVPFILMNSFNTDEDTARVIQKYANHNIEIMTFNQSRFPRVNKESLLPCPRSATEDRGMWWVTVSEQLPFRKADEKRYYADQVSTWSRRFVRCP